ncbi:penicillin acylase family protein [Pseudoalteromonas sp. OFAV1]|uniref:penicillin acylase family protein n=1 Tax=Pseudoalteromonas sp. OFAV1 TaxID=2908892 RepID=UPI001F304088|nr:penicillin acylase family protein [Pseudoalteromonas sp. OFAV1]MCF2902084.1 penicillin acylase family protein [Pseudoalteromonas sp. OFAV1]
MAEVNRDINGITYINGSTDKNAFYALGYAHASDRMWQLEVQRRIGSGRLSEIFGENTLDQDIWLRTIGLYNSAKESLQNHTLSPEEFQSLYAYTSGINAWLAEGNELPPEFHFFGIEPEYWEVLDSLAWMKAFQMLLAGNMWDEIKNSAVKGIATKEMYESIFNLALNSNSKENSFATTHELLSIENDLVNQFNLGGKNLGSNGWVVSGRHMESGKPTLVNDPHLGVQGPSLFYNAKVQGDKISVQGMTLVGLPFVIFGKNEHIAWGGTSLMGDVQDIFVEQINPNNPNQYLFQGEWHDMTLRDEYIKVARKKPAFLNNDKEPIHIVVKSTNKGPLISESTGYNTMGNLSVSWVALTNNDTTYSAFYKLNYAKNWEEFKEAFSRLVAPALNVFYIDNKNIGQLVAGHIPIRTKGKGEFIQSGWEDYSWHGFIPYNKMYKSFNPEVGFLANANQKVDVTESGDYVSSGFAEMDRYNRISELLNHKIKKNEKISVDYLKDMLKDTQSYEHKYVNVLTDGILCKSNISCNALQALKSWDGNFNKESVGGAIYSFYLYNLKSELFSGLDNNQGVSDNNDLLDSVIENVTYKDIVRIIAEDHDIWCEDSCNKRKQIAWDKVIRRLIKLKGNSVDNWKWGELNTLVYKHNPLSQLSWARPIFESRSAGEGSVNTINVSGSVYSKKDGFHQARSAAFRQIMSIDDNGGEHYFLLAPGQSGHPLSPFYRNFVEDFSTNTMSTYCDDDSCMQIGKE